MLTIPDTLLPDVKKPVSHLSSGQVLCQLWPTRTLEAFALVARSRQRRTRCHQAQIGACLRVASPQRRRFGHSAATVQLRRPERMDKRLVEGSRRVGERAGRELDRFRADVHLVQLRMPSHKSNVKLVVDFYRQFLLAI